MHAWPPPPVPDPDRRFLQPSFAFRLDESVRQFHLPVPTHVKLDVDGAELHVLEGFGALLDAPALQTMLVEIEHGLTVEVPQLLAAHGLALASRYQREKEAPCWYGLFQRSLPR